MVKEVLAKRAAKNPTEEGKQISESSKITQDSSPRDIPVEGDPIKKDILRAPKTSRKTEKILPKKPIVSQKLEDDRYREPIE